MGFWRRRSGWGRWGGYRRKASGSKKTAKKSDETDGKENSMKAANLRARRSLPARLKKRDTDSDSYSEDETNVNFNAKLPLKDEKDDEDDISSMSDSDDEFMKKFPAIDIIKKKKSRRRGPPRTIAEYAIPNLEDDTVLTTSKDIEIPNVAADAIPGTLKGFATKNPACDAVASTSKDIELPNVAADAIPGTLKEVETKNSACDAVPRTSKDIEIPNFAVDAIPGTSKGIATKNSACDAIPSTSKGIQVYENKNISSKRNFNDILVFDEDTNSTNRKKFKTDEWSTTEDEVEDEDEEGCINPAFTSEMSFPRMGEDINFDVSSLSQMPGFRVNFGDKRMAEFLQEKSLTTECIEHLYKNLVNAPKEVSDLDPKGLTVQLMPHQRQALTWMKWRERQKPSGGILADDMGLGKTLQMIALILDSKNEKKAKDLANGIEDESDIDFDDDWDLADPSETFQGKTLVICPLSLLKQWEREINLKCRRGTLTCYVYHGNDRFITEKKLSKFDVVITTYNLVNNELELNAAPKKNKDSRIFKLVWDRVILDEAHYIRNHKSKACNAVCELTAKSKWALTGTPIQNHESDMFALIKFVGCKPFDEWSIWQRWVSSKNALGCKRLLVLTKSLMLRRTKEELISIGVIQSLPQKNFQIVEVKFDHEEQLVYSKLLLYSQSFFHEFLRQKKEREYYKLHGRHADLNLICQQVPDKLSKIMRLLMKHHSQIGNHFILVLILRLRQMCCHPALIKAMLDQENIEMEGYDQMAQQVNATLMAEIDKLMTDEEDSDDDEDTTCFKIDEKTAKNVMSRMNPVFRNDRKSSKVRAVLKRIEEILENGEKVVVVSQWTGFLEVIAFHLQFMKGAKYNMFSGKVAMKDRQVMVDRINDIDDSLNILLLSLTAGGVGLNLVGANNLLLIDLHWNPQLETQAQDRIYRFGQENNVRVFKFICKDSIEEKIKILQDKKLAIADKVLTGSINNRLTLDDLKLLFS